MNAHPADPHFLDHPDPGPQPDPEDRRDPDDLERLEREAARRKRWLEGGEMERSP